MKSSLGIHVLAGTAKKYLIGWRSIEAIAPSAPLWLPVLTPAHIAFVLGNKFCSMSVRFAIPAQAAGVLLIAVVIVWALSENRAANDPSVLAITSEKAPSRDFSWVKIGSLSEAIIKRDRWL